MYFKSTLWRQYNQRMCSLQMWYVNPSPPPSLPFNNNREFFIRVQFSLTDRASDRILKSESAALEIISAGMQRTRNLLLPY